jgi:hypothetical protein
MRTSAPRYPRPQSLVAVIQALRVYIPLDGEPTTAWRWSENGQPNLRFSAATGGLPWIVDIYCGHYYRAAAGNMHSDICRSIPSLIGYLHQHLGLVPIDQVAAS